MAKIIGNTTATPNPRPDWLQKDSSKADYIKNKPVAATEINKNSTDEQYASAKAVFDLVMKNTEVKALSNPKIWELDKGWHYINQGFYVSKDEYIKIHSAVIYKTQGANLTCTYMGFGSVDYKQSNTIWGQVIVGESGVAGYCTIEKFTEEIDASAPSEHTYPSEKAIVDYISDLKHIETLTKDIDIDGDFPSGVYLTNGYLVKFLNSEGHMLFNNAYFPVLLIHYRLSDGRYFGLYHECSPTNDEYYGGYISMYNSEYGKKVLADEDFVQDQVSTLITEIDKKIDKVSLVTNIDEESKDDQIASAKAVYDSIMENKGIKTLLNPKIWELEPGIYAVSNGFYHSNKKEMDDLENGIPNEDQPFMSTDDYQVIDHEMFLVVYRKHIEQPNTICRFAIFGNNTESYSGKITMDMRLINDEMYAIYDGNFVINAKTTFIDENATDNESPTSKAVVDYVKDQISSLVGSAPETLDTLAELSAALNDNADILDLLATKKDLNDIDAKIDDIAKNQLNDLLSDVMTEEGKSGEKVEVPTSQAVQAELNIVNTKIEDLLEYTNEHLGDITDLITDKMTEEGLEGTNKVELPTARAINDYVENKLSNYTTQATQVQIITWEADD